MSSDQPTGTCCHQPVDITPLQQIFGGPDIHAMGSSVVAVKINPNQVDLETLAQKQYQNFCGEIWNRFGPENWLGPWRELYRRSSNLPETSNILEELRSLKDDHHSIDLVVSMLLDNIDNPEGAHAALTRVFDDPAIDQLSFYRLGDGGAFNGLLIAATTLSLATAGEETIGQAIFLTFLMD